MEMYLAHFGNQSYVVKTMGLPVTFEDYIMGYIFLGIILLMIMGPLYFFSSYSNFSVLNPVFESEISVSIFIDKTLSVADLENRMVPSAQQKAWEHTLQDDQTELFISEKYKDLYNAKNLDTRVPYQIFKNDHPFLSNVTEEGMKKAAYSGWTETKFFKNDQI